MFELHLADGLTVQNTAVSSPVVIIGNSGQGKTVFLIQLALELIKQKQTGLLYDAFGDLAEDIKAKLVSPAATQQVKFISQEDFVKTKPKIDSFFIVTGKTINDGAIYTRGQAEQVTKLAQQNLTSEHWLIIEQAYDFATPEIFTNYLSPASPKTFLSGDSLINLSTAQRAELFKTTKQLVVYKPRNLDGRLIEENYKTPTAKDIAAIQQYHFYWLDRGQAAYHRAIWPIKDI